MKNIKKNKRKFSNLCYLSLWLCVKWHLSFLPLYYVKISQFFPVFKNNKKILLSRTENSFSLSVDNFSKRKTWENFLDFYQNCAKNLKAKITKRNKEILKRERKKKSQVKLPTITTTKKTLIFLLIFWTKKKKKKLSQYFDFCILCNKNLFWEKEKKEKTLWPKLKKEKSSRK